MFVLLFCKKSSFRSDGELVREFKKGFVNFVPVRK